VADVIDVSAVPGVTGVSKFGMPFPSSGRAAADRQDAAGPRVSPASASV